MSDRKSRVGCAVFCEQLLARWFAEKPIIEIKGVTRVKKADIIASLLGLALCIYIWISSEDFPQDVVMHIGPDFFPRILATMLGVACLLLLLQALRRKVEEAAETLSPKDPGIRRGLVVLAMTLLYIAVMDFIGFIIATVVFMMAMMYVLKLRNYLKMFCVSLAISIVVNFAFGGVLDIQLPMGLLENIF